MDVEGELSLSRDAHLFAADHALEEFLAEDGAHLVRHVAPDDDVGVDLAVEAESLFLVGAEGADVGRREHGGGDIEDEGFAGTAGADEHGDDLPVVEVPDPKEEASEEGE